MPGFSRSSLLCLGLASAASAWSQTAPDAGALRQQIDNSLKTPLPPQSVQVSREAAADGFQFALPPALADRVAADDAIVVTRESGRPLPAWLTFDRQHMQFVATAVPARGLPLNVLVTIAGHRTLIVITRAPGPQAHARATGATRSTSAKAKPGASVRAAASARPARGARA